MKDYSDAEIITKGTKFTAPILKNLDYQGVQSNGWTSDEHTNTLIQKLIMNFIRKYKQMDAELKGQGVDVDQLTAIRQQLDAVMDQLKYIEEHRPDFISWQNDIREYFNLEQQKRDERRLIRQQIENLKEKFDKRRVHYEEKIKGLAKDLNSLREEQHRPKRRLSHP